jgi:hypothetical protein
VRNPIHDYCHGQERSDAQPAVGHTSTLLCVRCDGSSSPAITPKPRCFIDVSESAGEAGLPCYVNV